MSEGRGGVWRTGGTVGAMTFLSRILGFVRDMVLARVFGAGIATDAFFVAFRIPNFLRRLFGEGGFTLAYVPSTRSATGSDRCATSLTTSSARSSACSG